MRPRVTLDMKDRKAAMVLLMKSKMEGGSLAVKKKQTDPRKRTSTESLLQTHEAFKGEINDLIPS